MFRLDRRLPPLSPLEFSRRKVWKLFPFRLPLPAQVRGGPLHLSGTVQRNPNDRNFLQISQRATTLYLHNNNKKQQDNKNTKNGIEKPTFPFSPIFMPPVKCELESFPKSRSSACERPLCSVQTVYANPPCNLPPSHPLQSGANFEKPKKSRPWALERSTRREWISGIKSANIKGRNFSIGKALYSRQLICHAF